LVSVLYAYSSDEVAQPSSEPRTLMIEAMRHPQHPEDDMLQTVLTRFFKRHPSPLQEAIKPMVADRIREMQSSARNTPTADDVPTILPAKQIVLDSIQAMMEKYATQIKQQQDKLDDSVSKKKAGGIAAVSATITAVITAITPIIIHFLGGSV